ncbi:HAMP domain-containing protein [Carboxydocella thermautotrophica]|nr:HAMP domain-containing protein [Carboxydocella thermautotrophica]
MTWLKQLRESIVVKLWLSMVLLFVGVMIILGLVLSSMFEQFYFNWQARDLINRSLQVGKVLAEEGDWAKAYTYAEILSKEDGSTIGITNSHGVVMGCSNPEHFSRGARLSQEELEALDAGRILIKQGNIPGQRQTLLMVLVPVELPVSVMPGMGHWRGGRNTSLQRVGVFAYVPVAPITETILQVRLLLSATAMGAVALITVLGLLMSRKITTPVLAITEVAIAMIKGDFSRRVEISSQDEIGRLGQTLNKLGEELERSRQAQEGLEKMRRDFIANVSHELRTPLFLIQGYTEALQEGLAADEAAREELLAVIMDETRRMQGLVNELLDLARYQAGQAPLRMEPIQVEELLAGVAQKFRPWAQEQGISLEVEAQPGPPLTGDYDALTRVLINLTDNALRHTPAGGQVTLLAEPEADGWKIKVRDSGYGIPAADIPYIFERFYKVDKARTRGRGGTGLGLAIARSIVEAHGGSIKVESEEGKGTEFQIFLPAKV